MNWFTRHPNEVGETYFEHAKVALGFSRRLLMLSLQAAIHSALPEIFKDSASKGIAKLNVELEQRRRRRRN